MGRRISTKSVEQRDRRDYWQEACREFIGTVEIEDYGAEDFEGTIDVTDVGDLRLARFTGVRQTVRRRPFHLRSSDVDDYALLIESENPFVFEHCGRQGSSRGSMVVFDVARPYDTTHPNLMDVTNVLIPRRTMELALGTARHAAGLSIDPSQAGFPLVASFMRSLKEHGGSLSPASARRMASIAVDLVVELVAEKFGEAPPRTMSGVATLTRAQAYIAERIGVPGLSIQDVAGALKVSVRRLHQIAAAEGLSLIDWMWDRRLQRAREMLADPAYRTMPVFGIASQLGFVDQAHFSRRFKAEFGQTPTEFRASQATSGIPTA